MNRKTLVVALGLLTFVNLSGFGYLLYQKFQPADRPTSRQMLSRQRRNPMRALGLKREQMQRFRKAQRRFRLEADSLNRKIRIAQMSLLDELLRASPNSARLDSLLRRINDLRYEVDRKLVEHLLAQKTYLTPEQQAALFRMITLKLQNRYQKGRRRVERPPKTKRR